jgi:hypothetical protein
MFNTMNEYNIKIAEFLKIEIEQLNSGISEYSSKIFRTTAGGRWVDRRYCGGHFYSGQCCKPLAACKGTMENNPTSVLTEFPRRLTRPDQKPGIRYEERHIGLLWRTTRPNHREPDRQQKALPPGYAGVFGLTR